MRLKKYLQSIMRWLLSAFALDVAPERKERNTYLTALASNGAIFTYYSDVLFVVQAHCSGATIKKCLEPFLNIKAQNILIFADGCNDSTASDALDAATGRNHIVLCRNNTHEINNYRLSLSMAKSMGCEYAVFLQDDDWYDDPRRWINRSINYFEADEKLVIIGLNGGESLTSMKPRKADENFATSAFWTVDRNGRKYWGIGDYCEREILILDPTSVGSNAAYAAVVNRAPQIMRVQQAIDLGFFPRELEPYQYDDDFNCYTAWISGYKVLHVPIIGKHCLREGGMRMFNSVTSNLRPDFHRRNYNFVFDKFSQHIASGHIQALVEAAGIPKV